ncbi:alpha/beta hydrolase family protein [Polynucleobacter kasalickyi]|uniref:Prolyl oligopeptidase family protein n=1 Tax=Polynucleobacter kasalickyi TaxID=1938817 RepID=A0A1W1Y263_9BURK|nr:prolyl oligopeptidase family serine peptidase [Polynucleobacter kasalickyi]SMC30237.1 Prolyl oligopeptidase family protein [Polynucleobacter kasalickyi]
MSEKKDPPYFMYFPGNYRWSAAFINMLSAAPYGGSEIGELHKIGTKLKGKSADDDEAWFTAVTEVADGVRAYAEQFASKNYQVSAAHAYQRAANYYHMAERFRTPKDARALDVFQRGIDCFREFIKHTDYQIEIVEVPYEDGSLPGYFVHAQNSKREKNPCIVYFDGLDVTKEIQFMRGVPDLVKRGFSVLIMDGPGTGEAIRLRQKYLRYDYEVAGSACIDYLETRADVNVDKIGIVAISLGGYYAPRCAAKDTRYKACIAWGAQWDYYQTWKGRIEAQFKTSLSVPGHHINWILGVDTLEQSLEVLKPFTLDGVMQEMTCPFLLVHGAEDEQIPLADAQKQFDACGSKDKTFRVYTAEEGGSQHCQRDYLTLVVADMWNWFEEKLMRN